jgi:aryl-alcohol dehydrogenase-like predicted oxidoreductase
MRILFVGDSMPLGGAGEFTWRYRMWQHLERTCAEPYRIVDPRETLHEGAHDYADPAFPPAARRHLAAWGHGRHHTAPAIADAVRDCGADTLLVSLGLIDRRTPQGGGLRRRPAPGVGGRRAVCRGRACLKRTPRRCLVGMKYTQLGRTGLTVSRLVLGTMNFGPQTDEADSHAIMDAALGAGLNFFDTANVYGWGENKGRTEQIIGTWFAKGGARRDRTVLATKVYGNMGADGPAWPNHDKLSAVNIRRAVDASLTRLQTDHIDVYQFHHVDRSTPWDEIWQAMDVLVQQGKILYVGSSNHAGWHLAQANETAARRGSVGLVSEQCLYNLAERRAEMEVIPAAQGYGLGVIPWSPLHGGLLGGAVRKEREGGGARSTSGRAAEALTDPATRAQIEAYEDLLAKHGLEPGEVALAWLLTRPGITGPIVGPRTAEQLSSALRAVELELSDELLASLDEIFPGPGPSPEAFAW